MPTPASARISPAGTPSSANEVANGVGEGATGVAEDTVTGSVAVVAAVVSGADEERLRGRRAAMNSPNVRGVVLPGAGGERPRRVVVDADDRGRGNADDQARPEAELCGPRAESPRP